MWLPKISKEVYKLPKSVQKSIPVLAAHPNGIFEHMREYSMCCRFSDINYAVADEEKKKEMFFGYQDLINTFDTGCLTKITIMNRRVNAGQLKQELFIPEKGDRMDAYRREINALNFERATVGNNNIIQDKYITVSAQKRDVQEAKALFLRVENNLKGYLAELGSRCERISSYERLQVLHDFFRTGNESDFHLDLELMRKKGHDFKDYISPDGMEFQDSCFKIDDLYGRAICLREYPSYMQDTMISEMMDLPKQMILSLDLIAKSTGEAIRVVNAKLLAIETEIANSTKKAGQLGNWNASVPLRLERMRDEMREMLHDLQDRDQRLILAQVTIVHLAESLEELNSDTDTLMSIGRKHMCQFGVLRYQQEQGLNTALPYGLRFTETLRTLTTESVAVMVPFTTQEVWDRGGICYGTNQISKNLLIADRRQLMNGNGFILGVPGGGKSFFAKAEMVPVYLQTNDDILIIDPEREYSPLVRLLGGEVIHIAAGSKSHINAMDLSHDITGDDDPLAIKSEFLLSLAEQFMGTANIGPRQKSIIDRCTRKLLTRKKTVPTLKDLYDLLLSQPEDEAKDIALCLEIFVTGSLNTFAHHTNVDTNNRLICYDIKDLGAHMKGTGMLVVLDAIFSRVARNRAMGKRTWIYIDEVWLLFRYQYTSDYLSEFWRRMRKYGGLMTGITQNVQDILKSDNASTMLANSEFILMLNQAATDSQELAKLLNISDSQLSYITNAPQGHGLLRRSSALIPFDATFNTNTQLYKAMTTKIEEVAQLENQGDKNSQGKA